MVIQLPSLLATMASTIVGGVHDAAASRLLSARLSAQPSANQPATMATASPQGELDASVPAPDTYRIQFAANSLAPLASSAALTRFQPAAAFDWSSKSSRALRPSDSPTTLSPLKISARGSEKR